MNECMSVAFEQALLAKELGEVPVGAAVFKDGKLIAKAHNLVETNRDPMAHAEIFAMKEALRVLGAKNLSGCSLYVTLEPCAMCIGAAHLCKMERVYFGAYDEKSGACGGRTDVPWSGCFDYKTEIYGSIAEPQCRELLTTFFKNVRRERSDGGGV